MNVVINDDDDDDDDDNTIRTAQSEFCSGSQVTLCVINALNKKYYI
jgi:hypothetical protein